MGTPATISIKENGTFKTILLHFDGYSCLQVLKRYYNSEIKARELIGLGDLSILSSSCECPEGHSYETPIEGYCVAYHRDRGEHLAIRNFLDFHSFSEFATYQSKYNCVFDADKTYTWLDMCDIV
jgi:hypothetical protein